VLDDESVWDELLSFIEARSVIPVVGPALGQVEHGGRRPYRQVLAEALARKLKLGGLPAAPTLDDVTGAFLREPGSKRQQIYSHLSKVAAETSVETPEALRQLARVDGFGLFATFCIDDLLTRALNQERFSGRAETRELAFTLTETNDLPEGESPAALVYYLFGRISVLPKYAVAEDDMLEWVAALQAPEKRPQRLFDALGSSHLLFLGCDFPDWLARFVLRAAKNAKLSTERDFSEYLVESPRSEGDRLVVFLHRFSRNTRVLSVDPALFVAELEQRWRARQKSAPALSGPQPAPMAETMPPGSVFISYASEDRPAALRLAAELQAAGLPVWLDRAQLDWGSDYTARIQTAVRDCALFVPVLSRTSETKIGFFRKEWAWAVERNLDFTGSSVRFLFPVVIDDAPVFTSTEIPAAFRTLHIEAAPGGGLGEGQRGAIASAFQAMRARLGMTA
jgi:hypothetical protein